MKRLLTLVFALLVTFTLMGCEGETIIEERIEVVEVERIVIETVTEKLTDEQIATMEEVIEIKLDKKYKEEYSALEEDLIKTYDEELAKAIEELEPEIIYETIVKTEIEYVDRVEIQKVYVNKDMGEYTDQEYLALKEELENEIDTLSGLVEDKNLEIEELESDLVEAQNGIEFLTNFILEVADGAKALQVYVGIDESVTYASYQEMFSAIASEYTVLEERITELENQLATSEEDNATLQSELDTALEGIDFLHAFILQIAEDAKLLQVHVGISEDTIYLSYEEMFNAIANAYTILETQRNNLALEVQTLQNDISTLESEKATLESDLSDTVALLELETAKVSQLTNDNTLLEDEIATLENDLADVQENLDILTQNYIDLWREYEYHRAITEDEIDPKLEWALFQNDEVGNLVLTVHASDNIGVKSLEVDHNIVEIPEFTLYTEDVPASEDTYGASVEYISGVWTINFGETMTAAIREYTSVTFYFVAKDLANNTSGTMYYVQPEMTFTFDVPVFEEVPS